MKILSASKTGLEKKKEKKIGEAKKMSQKDNVEDGVHPISSNINVNEMNIKSILSNQGATITVDHAVSKDEATILALGYKQEFKREFSLWTVFCVSFSVLGLLPSVASTFDYQQLVIGFSPIPWLIGVIFVCSVAFSMAEVASAFPTSLGTPYAVSQLAPPKCASLFTWLTCFSNWLCQITSAPSINYSGACMILALGSFNSSNYSPSNGQIYGLTAALQVIHAVICCLPTKWLAQFNVAGTSLNMIFLVVVFVMIFAGDTRLSMREGISKFNSNSKAWGLENQTDFPTGIAMLQSFLGVIWAMSGYDSPFHLSEECSNARTAAPKAIVLTATCGGLIGWFFMLAIAYTAVSVKEISDDTLGLGQPYVSFLTQVMTKKLVNAATAMTIVSSFFMGCSCMLAASRVTYAYARDGLFPLSRYWKIVDKRTKTPINAVLINFVIGQLLLLLIFAGDTAIGAIFSVGGIAGFVSFTMPTVFKVTYSRNTFKPGPWNLGKFSTPIGIVSIAFVLVMIPILCFPNVTGSDLTLDEMNWTVVVYFGPMLIALLAYVFDAHKWYRGPQCNIDPHDITYHGGIQDSGVYEGAQIELGTSSNGKDEAKEKITEV